MKITSGFWDNMVFQRSAGDCSDQLICGTSLPDTGITATVTDSQGQVVNSAVSCGKTGSKGEFALRLQNIPIGGPYDIQLNCGDDQIACRNILVGDVWILAGQSNMQGPGFLSGAPEPDDMVRAFYMDDHWDIAREPIHNLRQANAEIHWTISGITRYQPLPPVVKGTGPGVFFGLEMFRRTGIPQGLIACAHGGTRMTQWDPALKDLGGNSLYGAMYDRFTRNGSRAAGMLWYQGCSDATEKDTPLYLERNIAFFAAVRKDFDLPELPVVMVQLSRHTESVNQLAARLWSRIREDQRCMPDKVANLLTVPAIDLTMEDHIHLNSAGFSKLAPRMAEAMLYLQSGGAAGNLPIELDSITIDDDTIPEQRIVTVSFKNVIGSLHSNSLLPLGFTCHKYGMMNELGTPPFRVDLCGNQAILRFPARTQTFKIAYGYGSNPAVTIMDEAGRALPSFGPLYIQNPALSSEDLPEAYVSAPVWGDESPASLIPPANLDTLKFELFKRESFYIAPQRINNQGPYVRFIRFVAELTEDMKLQMLAGADGPFRVFCDGAEIGFFPEATNPLIRDKYCMPLNLSAGEHEFVIGLSGKCGNVWGIAIRFTDPAKILTTENEYAMITEFQQKLLLRAGRK